MRRQICPWFRLTFNGATSAITRAYVISRRKRRRKTASYISRRYRKLPSCPELFCLAPTHGSRSGRCRPRSSSGLTASAKAKKSNWPARKPVRPIANVGRPVSALLSSRTGLQVFKGENKQSRAHMFYAYKPCFCYNSRAAAFSCFRAELCRVLSGVKLHTR